MSDKEQEKTPLVRFRAYAEAWKERELSELMEFSNGINAPKENYGTGRKMISVMDILDQDEIKYDNIRNSVNVNNKIEEKNKVENGDIVFVRSSEVAEEVGWAKAYLDEEYALFSGFTIRGKRKEIYNAYFVQMQLNYMQRKQFESKAGGSTRFNVSQTILNGINIRCCSVAEQNKISHFLRSIDYLCALYQREVELLKLQKQTLLSKMFPKEGELVPEIRVNCFTDDWEQRKLGDIMDVTSVKRIHQSDWTNSGVRFLRARDIVSDYKREEPDEYLYISKSKYDEYSKISGKVEKGNLLVTGVGSIGVPYLIKNSTPIYFKDGNIIWFKNKNLDGRFLYYSFTGNEIQNFIRSTSGSGTVGTYTIDSGKKTPIMFPVNREQEKIGLFFEHLDKTIALHQRKLETIKEMKKTLLKYMFV